MRVFASHVFSWNIENDEVTLGNEGHVLRELADRETATKIREERKAVDRHPDY